MLDPLAAMVLDLVLYVSCVVWKEFTLIIRWLSLARFEGMIGDN